MIPSKSPLRKRHLGYTSIRAARLNGQTTICSPNRTWHNPRKRTDVMQSSFDETSISLLDKHRKTESIHNESPKPSLPEASKLIGERHSVGDVKSPHQYSNRNNDSLGHTIEQMPCGWMQGNQTPRACRSRQRAAHAKTHATFNSQL